MELDLGTCIADQMEQSTPQPLYNTVARIQIKNYVQ